MDSVDQKQQDAIDGLERREKVLILCAVIGAVGSLFQIWESLVVFWRLK